MNSADMGRSRFLTTDHEQLAIVTFGCGVAIPGAFKNVHQSIGGWDKIGQRNTPTAKQHDPSLDTITAQDTIFAHAPAAARKQCKLKP